MTATTDNCELRALVQDSAATVRRLAGVIRQHGTCAPFALESIADRLDAALLTRTEAGATQPQDPDKSRIGIVHTGKLGDAFPMKDAAPVADEAATVRAVPLWISSHWREDLARDSVVSVVNRQDPAHTVQIYVSTHPQDAGAGDAGDARRYRWPRDRNNAHVSLMPRGDWLPDPSSLDAAIDAALQQAAGGGRE